MGYWMLSRVKRDDLILQGAVGGRGFLKRSIGQLAATNEENM